MKLVVTADGESMSSMFCPNFEECEYLIIYDTDNKLFGSRVSPSFKTKDKAVLIDFLKRTFMENIITGTDVGDGHFNVYKPYNMNATVNDVLIECIETLS